MVPPSLLPSCAIRTAQVTVRFISKLISATHDHNGAVIDGNAEKVTDVTDVWTFALVTFPRVIPTGKWLRPKPGSEVNDGVVCGASAC